MICALAYAQERAAVIIKRKKPYRPPDQQVNIKLQRAVLA